MHPESLEVVLKNVRGETPEYELPKKVYRNSIRLFKKKRIKLSTRTPKRVNNPVDSKVRLLKPDLQPEGFCSLYEWKFRVDFFVAALEVKLWTLRSNSSARESGHGFNRLRKNSRFSYRGALQNVPDYFCLTT
jgi:hypothetical protein